MEAHVSSHRVLVNDWQQSCAGLRPSAMLAPGERLDADTVRTDEQSHVAVAAEQDLKALVIAKPANHVGRTEHREKNVKEVLEC